MKRVIKFRVWDGKSYMDLSKCVIGIEVDTGDLFKANDIGEYNEFQWIDNIKDIEQFTGLHDRNGIEIYEGDLIRIGAGHEALKRLTYKVVYDVASFHLEPPEGSTILGKTAFINYATQLFENIEDFYSRD